MLSDAQPLAPKEKILFEVQPLLLPTILTLSNLVSLGFVALAILVVIFFQLGFWEILIIAALFLVLIVPSMSNIFQTGSTHYVLTNQRLVIFKASLKQKQRSIPLSEIDSIKVAHSGLQLMYGAGDILVKRKGLKSSERLFGLKEVKKLADQIRQAQKQFV